MAQLMKVAPLGVLLVYMFLKNKFIFLVKHNSSSFHFFRGGTHNYMRVFKFLNVKYKTYM